jgi:hypothetical protein
LPRLCELHPGICLTTEGKARKNLSQGSRRIKQIMQKYNHKQHDLKKYSKEQQHFATLHHTSPNYTSLQLSTLHFLSFTLHYPLIWLHPSTFPTALFHPPSLNYTQYCSPISKLISKIMNPFTALQEPLTISRHFTFFFLLSYQPFTSFYIANHVNYIYNSLSFNSLPFTLYRLPFHSLVFNFLTLVLNICFLPWEVPIALFSWCHYSRISNPLLYVIYFCLMWF